MAEKFSASYESTVKDIILKSDEVKKGFPSVYKLRTKVKDYKHIRRVTFGKKDGKKIKNKTILLVGETGAGKSTLVNVMVNHAIGVKFEDGVWFQITEEEEKSQTESQTSYVTVYEIFGFEGKTLPFSLTIIDTPGFGNTQNTEQDLFVSQGLFDLFRSEDGVHEVDAVGLVMKATDNRLSDRLLYIFDSVMSLFGNDIIKNIIVMITHSNGLTPHGPLEALRVLEIKCARNEKNEPLHVLFDNCLDKERTDEAKEILDNCDKISRKGIRGLRIFLENTKSQQLEKTKEVMKERIRLAACIENLKDKIQLIEMKENEMQQTEKALKEHEKEMKMNQNFTIEVDEPYKEKQPIDGGRWKLFFYEGAVCCTHCEETCHHLGCTIAWSPQSCEVMKDGRCTVCNRKCLASAHVKEQWIYVNKTRKVKKTIKDMEEKYQTNKAASAEKQNLLESLRKEKKNLEADKTKWLCEAYAHVKKLNEISLKVETASTYINLEFLIEKMEKHDEEKCGMLKGMAKSADNVVRKAMKYSYNNLLKIFSGNQEGKSGTEV